MSQTIPQRKDIAANDKWDLSPLFTNDDEWQSLFKKIEAKINGFNAYRGKLGESVELFIAAIEFDLAISREVEKLYTYAHLKSDEDKTNQEFLGLYQKAVNLYTRISELASFMTPEIQAIPEEVMNAFLKDERMQTYAFYLEKILRFKPHTLSEEIEQILAMSGEIAQAASQVFSQLDNADLTFGTIEDDKGNKVELSHGNFNSFLINKSRDVRKNAFHTYYQAYDSHKNTIAASLGFSVKKDVFYSRVRKFDSVRQSALFSDNIPLEVYDNLLTTVRDNLKPLFDYLGFRKQALGLTELHFYDTYVPLIDNVDFHMPFAEAVEVCVKALHPLGRDYTEILHKGLAGGWVDKYENKGKRSGAYSSGCYDSPPYILMNYKDDNINSLYTLIHEAGHSMHSYYSKEAQPYLYSDYTIFVAEVASTFNETLLSDYLLKFYVNDPRMKAYIINREIDNIRATLYRQTMFAEYEKITHEIIENNDQLTLEVLQNQYRALLETYFGDTIVIDNELSLEGLRIPHFYSAFYVYKYATGISAAIALADKVLNGGERERNDYLRFLTLGGSSFPLDELLDAGVDMRNPEPIVKAIKHFNGLVQQLQHVYKEL